MPTYANKPDVGLNDREFSKARKSMLLTLTVEQSIWEKASERQKDILHQIELTIKSVSEEELKHLHF